MTVGKMKSLDSLIVDMEKEAKRRREQVVLGNRILSAEDIPRWRRDYLMDCKAKNIEAATVLEYYIRKIREVLPAL